MVKRETKGRQQRILRGFFSKFFAAKWKNRGRKAGFLGGTGAGIPYTVSTPVSLIWRMRICSSAPVMALT